MTSESPFRNDVPFLNDVGIEFVSTEQGGAVLALTLAARHLNGWSMAHGGVLMTLLDVAMAVAGRTLKPEAGGGITVQMQTAFINPARAGSRLLATARAYHRARSLAFCEGEVRDTEERLIATATGIFKYPAP